uniref:SUEL-type lectin domain-containing protein n=1 Tax=Oreochromis aureus TaxID=47969 RepID=A0A668U812_OREAU
MQTPHRGPSQVVESNSGPSCCEAAVLITASPCCPLLFTVTCEGSEANLQCGEIFLLFVLVVHRAHFGRQDKTTCSLGRSACTDADCLSLASFFLLDVQCSGKNNCSLSATSSVFGDPCIGTYKYLEVDYTCQFQSLTCEGFQANLQCAHYGRHDKTTCSAGRPASQLQVVTCSSQSSTDVVAKSCNGKKSCTIPATNSVFGDPCVGTYKYMQVVYTCQCKYLKE